ncbi:hypothetical protein B0T10DRAFT_267665 [Thelonectria olida]|uniref:Uncharacterized protein n=1 Tax=Thelonectria olida TaxID=1576542 RepID=A0A9P9ARQ6_9HYPO|nr:hypothetical protein B0T10DRAFT_267665 [Thelonectria olida]
MYEKKRKKTAQKAAERRVFIAVDMCHSSSPLCLGVNSEDGRNSVNMSIAEGESRFCTATDMKRLESSIISGPTTTHQLTRADTMTLGNFDFSLSGSREGTAKRKRRRPDGTESSRETASSALAGKGGLRHNLRTERTTLNGGLRGFRSRGWVIIMLGERYLSWNQLHGTTLGTYKTSEAAHITRAMNSSSRISGESARQMKKPKTIL